MGDSIGDLEHKDIHIENVRSGIAAEMETIWLRNMIIL